MKNNTIRKIVLGLAFFILLTIIVLVPMTVNAEGKNYVRYLGNKFCEEKGLGVFVDDLYPFYNKHIITCSKSDKAFNVISKQRAWGAYDFDGTNKFIEVDD